MFAYNYKFFKFLNKLISVLIPPDSQSVVWGLVGVTDPFRDSDKENLFS
jgi:hypothetical protein